MKGWFVKTKWQLWPLWYVEAVVVWYVEAVVVWCVVQCVVWYVDAVVVWCVVRCVVWCVVNKDLVSVSVLMNENGLLSSMMLTTL